MRICALTAVLAIWTAFPAIAADAVVEEVVVVDTAHDWSGVYVGAQGGYLMGASQTVDISGSQQFVGFQQVGFIPYSVDSDIDDFIGGAQIGYNKQSGTMVYGAELDFQFGPNGEPGIGCESIGDGCGIQTIVASELKWLGTVRGRIGKAFDRSLFYATAGLALGEVQNSLEVNETGSDSDDLFGSDSSTRFGWTIGAGAEYALTQNISVRGEYLYYNLSNNSVTATLRQDPSSPEFGEAEFSNDGQIVRLGVNYKF